MARVEAAQGGPFERPFVVAAYLDDDAYAAANGLGSPKARGVTYFDRVTMAPALWREEPGYLEADLVHELSHEHLWGHLSAVDYFQIPVWFVEGLAVTVSGGGGAQGVSVEEAEREIVGRTRDRDAGRGISVRQSRPKTAAAARGKRGPAAAHAHGLSTGWPVREFLARAKPPRV